jgi:phosphoglucosamine mutase
MIEAALVSGFTAAGLDVKLVGTLPTPGVALMTETLKADFGVMITASHNPYMDNGIKFFGPNGTKLSDEAELEIEHLLEETSDDNLAGSDGLGRTDKYEDAQARYIDIAKSTLPNDMRLSGLKIVLDCANGAAYETAPKTFADLGAEDIISIGVTPNGRNINKDCGSTSTGLLSETVLKHKAHMGIALDGDADRLIMCDEKGQIIDGDQLLALIGSGWQSTGRLSRPGIVATVMSNLGLERFLSAQNMSLIRTDVGDRHVAARMRADGYNIGGEQSGHLLMTDFAPTGDGTIAALQVLAEIIRAQRPASEVLSVFEPVPQILTNVRYEGPSPMKKVNVLAAIEDARADMGDMGRILVRASGTEPCIRVMAEGDDAARVKQVTDGLADVIRKSAE